ncbi:secretion system protein [Wolbachia endosymbiont of Pentidionis agamae]|uniref:secretion system protein n=1 Tax=Wolbachia endosymbiont of Pentidionis agamae TaxID=3110435 RepID=UPI002FD14618
MHLNAVSQSSALGADSKEHAHNEIAIPEIIPLPMQIPETMGNDQLMSVNISEDVPIKDLLIEVGKLADINLDINPKISGSIILKLKDKPIKEVIESIVHSAKLRYTLENNVIKIEQNLPYIKSYHINFINIERSAKSATHSQIMTQADDNSNNTLESQYKSDLWSSIEKEFYTIINSNGTDDGEFFSFNKETGIILLNARNEIHKAVEKYIKKTKRILSSQVMIEARIVEVVLNDEHLTGINFEALNNDIKLAAIENNFSNDLGYIMKELDKFGALKVVSGSKIQTINNQQAMMTFARKYVYFATDTYSKNMHNVPVGAILTVHPSINLDTEKIFVNLHTVLSRISEYTQISKTGFFAKKSKIKLNKNIPVIEVKEMDSMVEIKNGEVMIIGGLMEHRKTEKDHATSSKKIKENFQPVEIIILLKAEIIPSIDF